MDKFTLGFSGLLYLILAVVFFALFALAPYPYYNVFAGKWYLGPSIASRVSGAKGDGLPLDIVFSKVTKATISSPFEIHCTVNTDCKTYDVVNQCRVFCGNTASSNNNVQETLNHNRVCDPALWRRPATNCVCIHGACVDTN